MNIGGIVKNSFVDYPHKICCVVFTTGCNMNCWYCHNNHLLGKDAKTIEETKVLTFLKEHAGFLDAVTISGGEPTLQSDLIPFIQKIKQMGYLVKLDTNGTNFNVLKTIVENKLVDYIAMDVKSPIEKYNEYVNNNLKQNVINSINLLKQNFVPYEFRTTMEPNLSLEDITSIVQVLSGAENYSIQQYKKPDHIKNVNVENKEPLPEQFLQNAKKIATKYIKNVAIKSL